MGVDVPAEIAAVVDRALAADLAVRFRDARELGEALSAAGLSLPATPRAVDLTGASALVRAGAEGTGDSETSRAPTTTPAAWTENSRAAEAASTRGEMASARPRSWVVGAVALLVISGLAGIGGVVLSKEPTRNTPAQTAAPAIVAPIVPARAEPPAFAPDAGSATAAAAGDTRVGGEASQHDDAAPDVGVPAPTGRVPRNVRVGGRGPRTPPPTGANGSLIID